MSLSASCESVCQKRTLSSLLAGRVAKRPKQENDRRLQEAAIQLLDQQQNLCSLFREVGNPDNNIFSSQTGNQQQATSAGVSAAFTGSLLACELRRQAARLGVSVAALSVKTVLERLKEITEESERREMLSSSQRVQLFVLLQSSRELLSQGALCPKLLWQELRRDQRQPRLEVVYHLHCYSIVTLKFIVETDEDLRSWLVPQLKALCDWTPPPEEEESKQIQQKVLSTVVGVLVGAGFEPSLDPVAADRRRISLLCCSLLDDLLFWFLDSVDKSPTLQSTEVGAQRWFCGFYV